MKANREEFEKAQNLEQTKHTQPKPHNSWPLTLGPVQEQEAGRPRKQQARNSSSRGATTEEARTNSNSWSARRSTATD